MTPHDQEIKKLLTSSPAAFARLAFNTKGYYEGKGLPSFVKSVFALVERHHPKTAIILPRGHTKSTTISKVYPLYEALRKPQFIRIYSATASLTQQISAAHDRQLRTNPILRYYFGDQVTSDTQWTLRRRVFANGSTIEYSSVGAQTRGATSDTGRPDLIILDDIESTESAKSEYQTEQIIDWLMYDVMPALAANGRIILLGTVISKIALAYKIASKEIGGWESLCLKACNFTTGEVLWPQNEKFSSIEKFIAMRDEAASIGKLPSFYTEYMNEPMDDVNQPFLPSMYQEYELLPKEATRYFCAIDLAYSGKSNKKSDRTAWVVGAVDDKNSVYVVEAGAERLDSQQRVDLCFTLAERYWQNNLRTLHIEGHTDFFFALHQEMNRRSKHFQVEPLKHGGVSKVERILTLQPMMRTIFFNVNNCKELKVELLNWNVNSTKDDLPDALAYLRKIALPAFVQKTEPYSWEREMQKKLLAKVSQKPNVPTFESWTPTRL